MAKVKEQKEIVQERQADVLNGQKLRRRDHNIDL